MSRQRTLRRRRRGRWLFRSRLDRRFLRAARCHGETSHNNNNNSIVKISSSSSMYNHGYPHVAHPNHHLREQVAFPLSSLSWPAYIRTPP